MTKPLTESVLRRLTSEALVTYLGAGRDVRIHHASGLLLGFDGRAGRRLELHHCRTWCLERGASGREGPAFSRFPNDPAGSAARLAWLRELGGIERIGLEGSAG
jgi:hypothetical protein